MNYKLFTIILTAFILLNFNLGKWGIMETSEARYAQISKEMVENEDYIHPKLLGIYHYHKPPITYQITTLGYKMFGVNEFGARFFMQLAIIIQLLLIYHITLVLFKNKNIALTASLIYFSLPIVLISSRNLTTDAYLNTFVLASIYSWINWKLKSGKVLLLYLFYLFLGISFEIKGPVSLLFPLIFILIYKIVNKERLKPNLHHFFGVLLFFIVAFVWYLIVVSENERLWDYFFKDQIVNRIASKSYNRAKPFWFYLATIPLIGLPWIFILGHYLKTQFKGLLKSKNIEFVLYITIISLVVIFSIFKTKLILYVLPVFSFVSIATAKALSKVSIKSLKIYNRIILALIVIFLLGILSIRFLNMNIEFYTISAIVIIVLALVFTFIVFKKRFLDQYLKTAVLGFILGCIILVSGTQFLIQNEDLLNCPKKAIHFIDNDLQGIDNILVFNYLLASTNFYSDKNIVTINNGHNTVQRETQFEKDANWKENLIDLKTESGKQKVKEFIVNNSVLLMRKRDKFRDEVKFVELAYTHKKEFGKWVVYY
jgi:4-amino-4-deoxy-L-arabinose transferase